ncbi:MAG: CBS domain-containing protein [Flavobacteriales bacterium]|nr:CBS domain-containing protein [Flavobacteriales bacterium]MBL6872518.1 CBS domain-containing protein [Flavobacteriales bacterium]
MISKKLISKEIQTVTLEMTGEQALSVMQEFRLSHLAVVEDNKLIGVISEGDIWNMYDEGNKINSISDKIELLCMPLGRDVFEIIKYMDEHKLSLLPIIGDGKYFGAITQQSVIEALASIVAIQESGGVIILEMNKKDYSMSEIAQIVESNNLKILSAYVTDVDEKNNIKLTLKLNKIDIAAVIQTFERYNYNVAASYNYSENTDNLSDRFDSLMRYLNP